MSANESHKNTYCNPQGGFNAKTDLTKKGKNQKAEDALKSNSSKVPTTTIPDNQNKHIRTG